MQLENQVCSLELAQQLKDLDVKQESYFYYHWYKKNRDYEDIDCQIVAENIEEFDDGKWKLRVYSAFTVAELGEMLPVFSIGYNQLSIDKSHMLGWHVKYDCERDSEHSNSTSNDKLADALAEMLIHLLEQGLIKNENT